jgi:hypothetical protein
MISTARLRKGGVTVQSEDNPILSKMKSFWLAISDWRTWEGRVVVNCLVFTTGTLTVTHSCQIIVGSSTLSYFYLTLVSGLGYTNTVTVQAQYII